MKNHLAISLETLKMKVYLTLFQMSLFGAADGCWGQKAPAS